MIFQGPQDVWPINNIKHVTCELYLFFFLSLTCSFCSCLVHTRFYWQEVEIGGVGEIMKRSPSVTQRLLSASLEEDQTNLRSEARRENSREHAFLCCFMNIDRCMSCMKSAAVAQPFEWTFLPRAQKEQIRDGRHPCLHVQWNEPVYARKSSYLSTMCFHAE